MHWVIAGAVVGCAVGLLFGAAGRGVKDDEARAMASVGNELAHLLRRVDDVALVWDSGDVTDPWLKRRSQALHAWEAVLDPEDAHYERYERARRGAAA